LSTTTSRLVDQIMTMNDFGLQYIIWSEQEWKQRRPLSAGRL